MDSPSAVEFPLTPEPDAGEIWRLTDALSLSRDPSAKGDDNNGNSEDWISLKEAISDTFSRADRLMNVFAHAPTPIIYSNKFVDLVALDKWYKALDMDILERAFLGAFHLLLDGLKSGTQILRSGQMAAVILILRNPLLQKLDVLVSLMPKLVHFLAQLSSTQRIDFAWSLQESLLRSEQDATTTAQTFREVVGLFNRFITIRVLSTTDEEALYADDTLMWTAQSMAVFSAINEASGILPYYEFYNESIESCMDIKVDYPRWKGKEGFCFICYPFLLSTSVKSDILRLESMVRIRHELQDAFFRAMFIGVNSPYLQLEIRRDFLIRDAMAQLASEEGSEKETKAANYKRQLRIAFVGEDGIDEGGVQKEFFKLATDSIFDPQYGMFRMNPDSRLCWFTVDPSRDVETVKEYRLLVKGILIGLAIYNGVVLDIKFPLVLYKLLAGQPPSMSDLLELDPILSKSLETLLEFDGDVEDTFGQTFEIELETATGGRFPFQLKSHGKAIPVTNDNRKEFVDLYIQAYFSRIPDTPFSAFKDGYDSVLTGTIVHIFRPEELQELICGSPSLEFKDLEENAQYDGFEKNSIVIQWFWEVVHGMDEKTKKQLLSFTTGSDRVPVGGLSKLPFIIAKNGGDSNRLPTSHTCYNVLLLSEYASKERLQDRLMKALDNSDCGFFLN